MARDLLSDDSSEGSDVESGGADVVPELKVNADFAKRFEHNKKREELQRLEEKLGKNSRKRKRDAQDESGSGSDDDSSSSEDEDDEGELATTALDSEIMATLNAIRSKDPRVYDATATFYTETEAASQPSKEKKEKPIYLRDYHRTNLLNGNAPAQEEPLSYNQEQEQLKKSIVSEMHAAADNSDDEDEDEEGGIFVRKQRSEPSDEVAVEVDVKNADRDPETFLSNFMAARAWVPTDRVEMHPFESDDEEEEKRAEEFEEAYNMRFEDPEKSNATLRSHARDIAQQYSVRRDEQNSRKKKREAEKAAKEAAKQQLKDEKARLKKLRMEEVEEKVKRIKRAAGLKTSDLKPEDWSRFIDDEWDDDKWEAEMQRRFGDNYYADQDVLSDSGSDGELNGAPAKRKKPKKPKFDDDIDIKDIVPDFEDDDAEAAAEFSLSEEDTEAQPKKKSKKQERIEKQKDSRKERRIIEAMVDDQLKLDLDHALPAASRDKSAGFRYRETSPQSFGLTSRDILLADDSALNQFAGIKKLASWRPEDKKKKDRKYLGKKARLRKWRLDTFGDEDGPKEPDVTVQDARGDQGGRADSDEEMGGVDIREGSRKKKGRRKKKAKTDVSAITI